MGNGIDSIRRAGVGVSAGEMKGYSIVAHNAKKDLYCSAQTFLMFDTDFDPPPLATPPPPPSSAPRNPHSPCLPWIA